MPTTRTGRTASIRPPRRTTRRFLELLGAQPLDFTPLAELVDAAKADSLWQLLDAPGRRLGGPAELLAYAAPTYYGMAVAIVR